MTGFINVPRMWPTCLQPVKRQIHRLIISLSRAARHNTHGLFPKTFCLMFNRLTELHKQHPLQSCQTRGHMQMLQVRRGTVCSLSWGGLASFLHTSPFNEKLPSLQKGYGLTLAKYFNLVCTLKKKTVYLQLST